MTEPEPRTVLTAAVSEWVLKVLQRKGMFAADAEIVLDRLLESQQAGGSGLTEFEAIITAMDLGDIDPRARVLTLSEGAAFIVLDGSTGVGQVGATRAMLKAIEKAATTGFAAAVIKNSQPCDDLAPIARLAAAVGCVGFCTSNAGKATLPLTNDQPPWLSPSTQAWALPGPCGSLAITSSLANGSSPLLGHGLLSLALTAALTASRLPAQKKKASPFGNGAEHFCWALHFDAWGAPSSMADYATELLKQHTAGALQGVLSPPLGSTPEQLSLSTATLAALTATAEQVRIPLPW